MADKEKFELIITIVNEGHADQVMDAAREAGARGGTISSARGTGDKNIEKKYGVVITPQKEMVYIVVNVKERDQIISAINRAVGIETPGQGVIFSVPVDNISGINLN